MDNGWYDTLVDVNRNYTGLSRLSNDLLNIEGLPSSCMSGLLSLGSISTSSSASLLIDEGAPDSSLAQVNDGGLSSRQHERMLFNHPLLVRLYIPTPMNSSVRK